MTSGSVFTWRRFRCRPEILLHVLFVACGLTQLQRTNISNILRVIWYLLLSVGIAAARDPNRGPPYQSMFCTRERDCRRELGETCYKLYEGCSQGVCMCDPGTQAKDKNGRCRTVRRGRETCHSSDKCPDGMTCHYGRCQCYVGEMTLDGDYCLRASEKLLGQSCSHDDKCVQKSATGYITDEVFCSDLGICQCARGLKTDNNSCRRYSIDEYGCMENHHCDGGSVCVDRYCKCPMGRLPTAGGTKCGRRGALHGLPLGAPCDEIGERRYCDSGLVCHSCGDNGRSICVRSRLLPNQSPLYASQGASSLNHSSFKCLVLASFAYFMLMR